MTANTPPKPHAEGDRFTNTETGITYEFKSGAWRAVSSEAADAVADAISELDLEKVLTAGNVADKDIVLTDGIDDLIDISPTEGRIVIASDADTKTPKITLAHFGDIDEGNRKAEIELDENGTRLDFEMSGDVKDVHFRFGDNEKFILNHEGDAEFVGKVIVEAGTTGNEVVTFNQLAELNQEIEDIRPSLERGLWAYDASSTNPSSGKYIGYKLKSDETYCNEQLVACQLLAGDDVAAKSECTREYGECTASIGSPVLDVGWSDVDFISINKQDSNAELHTFADAEIGMYVEVMELDGAGFGLYQIVEPGIASGGQVTGFWVQHISSQGQQQGAVRVKVFELASADPTDYVRKAGDKMSGALQIQPDKDTETGLVVFAGKDLPAESKTVVFAVTDTKGNSIFEVKNHGRIKAGTVQYTPQYDTDIVTKKYADQLRGPATLAWRWLGAIDGATEPEDGGFYKSGDYLRVSFKTDNNIDLGDNLFPDTQYLGTQYGPFGTIWKYNEEEIKWQMMRQIRIDGFRWNYNNHMEYNLSSSHGRSFDDLVVGQAYYITIGGFF